MLELNRGGEGWGGKEEAGGHCLSSVMLTVANQKISEGFFLFLGIDLASYIV